VELLLLALAVEFFSPALTVEFFSPALTVALFWLALTVALLLLATTALFLVHAVAVDWNPSGFLAVGAKNSIKHRDSLYPFEAYTG
jgi:hypothetical protein